MTTTMTGAAFLTLLTTSIGLEPETPETTDTAGDATLTDLGLDSLGVIELEKVLIDEYGVELPEHAPAMSLKQILDHVNAVLGKEH
ncbi:acyl carrier protein (plasmid) [Streptomyces sp. CG1]|uniref:acyl carrier protein n=1 Tax=Streptomyces sp. CG1 TaxID=1287523 RepID=UPI0034E237A3